MKRKPNARYVLVSGGKAFNRRPRFGEPEAAAVLRAPEEALPETPAQDGPAGFGQGRADFLDDEPYAAKERPLGGAKPSALANETPAPSPEGKTALATRMRTAIGRLRLPKKEDNAGKTRTFAPVRPEISPEHLYEGGGTESIFTRRTKPRSLALSVFFSLLKMLAVLIVALGFAGLGAVTGIARAYIDTSPELDIGLIENQAQTSVIYDGNGNVITTFAGLENREWASSDEIPDMLKNAFVAIEDVRFYKHSGVDFKRLVSAVINTFRNENTHGGSTITQQLIKNRVLTSEQSYRRKIQEAFLAIELEAQYSKDEILEAYMNAIPLGGINYGVKVAAKDYFGKPLSALTIRECAMLAGITQNPTKFNPRLNYYDANRDKKTTDDRTDTVLLAMYNAGFITKEQYGAALEEDVAVIRKSSASSMYDMPVFVEYAVSEVVTCMLKDRGLEDTGANRAAMEKILRTGGYHIYTTVIPEIQNAVQDTLSTWDGYPKIADPTYSVKISKNADGTVDEIAQPQAAAVVIDQSTGRIVAMAGGRDTPTRKKLLNRAVASNMPVGSSLKPLSVYAPALEAGMSPASIIMNFAQPIEGYGGSRGYPTGGLTNQGPVTMRKSVISSLNVGAARVLFENVTPAASKNYLVSMGMDPDTIFADGPGLALGTSGISMLELTAAFATIADGGVYQSPVSFTVVKDSQGNVVLNSENFRTTAQIFKKSTAWLMTDMLKDAVKSGTGRSARINGMTVAGKTGTNESYRGVVFAGYTGYYTSCVWIGHDDYEHALKNGSTGGDFAAPLWQAYMSKIHEGLQDKEIIDSRPEDLGLVKATVCSVTGLLATDACRADDAHKPVTDWFYAGSVPTTPCNAHVLATVCTKSGKLATPYCPRETLAQKSILVVPADSPLAAIDPALMAKHMPEAILGFSGYSELFSLPVTDARYADYYCNIHSAYSSNLPTAEELNYARTILDFADTMLGSANYSLPSSVRTEILNLIRRLEAAVEEGVNGSLISSLSLELYQKCSDAQSRYYSPGATPIPEPEPVEENQHLYDYSVTP